MSASKRRFLLSPLGLVLAASLLGASVARGGAATDEPGIVVEEVAPGQGAEEAGLRRGDRLVGWMRTGGDGSTVASGRFSSPFDLVRVEILESSLGPVSLRVVRDGEISLAMPPMRWGVEARPAFPAGDLARYEAGRSLAAPKDAEGARAAAAVWAELATELARRGESSAAAWLRLRAAETLAAEAAPGPGAGALRAAVDGVRATGSEADLELAIVAATAVRLRRASGSRAGAALLEDAVERLGPGPHGLAAAVVLAEHGTVLRELGDLKGAHEALERAVDLLGRLAPRSYRRAEALESLAVTRFVQGALAAGEAVQLQAIDLLRELAPRSIAMARALTNRASLLVRRGELAHAESLYREADAIHRFIGSPEPRRAAVAGNLATVALRRGDLVAATLYAERAIELEELGGAGGPRIATMLAILARISLARDAPEEALAHLRRALAIQDAEAPTDPLVVAFLATAGWAALEAGDEVAADGFLHQAIVRLNGQGVRNLDVATGLRSLARVKLRQGDLLSARRWLEQARAIERELAPEGPGMAETLQLLGEVALEQGLPGEADERLSRALDLWRRSAPGSGAEARGLHLLGRARRTAGDRAAALRLFEQAIGVLEHRPPPPPSDYETVAEERAAPGELFDDTVALLLDLGRDADAFRVHEQSRARAFLDLLAMRELEPIEEARAPMEVDEALELATRFDPGALVLSYSSSAHGTHLFALGPRGAGLRAYSIEDVGDGLGHEIERLRALLVPGGSAAAIHVLSRRLGEVLLGPAADRIAAADRVLIAADGPLHDLPFAALAFVRPDSNGEPRLLIDEKPIAIVPSLKALRRYRRTELKHAPRAIVAFGDPTAPATPSPPLFDTRLERLPGARREVETLAGAWPGTIRTFLGADATEARAKAVGPGIDVVHFATHALVDERFPLSSAVVLAADAARGGHAPREDGLLQAWEIFEQMRLDAELVVLSGCETAKGRRLAGEGTIGLIRAFDYAGARSVLASLWKVPDEATALLMAGFYRHLAAGAAKDEALRSAQLALRRSQDRPALRHPHAWAAFQLTGDPR